MTAGYWGLALSYVGCVGGTVLACFGRRPRRHRACQHEPVYDDQELYRTTAVSDRFDLSIRWQVAAGVCVHCGERIASTTCRTGHPAGSVLRGEWAAVAVGRRLHAVPAAPNGGRTAIRLAGAHLVRRGRRPHR
jgi:hypothetical protein